MSTEDPELCQVPAVCRQAARAAVRSRSEQQVSSHVLDMACIRYCPARAHSIQLTSTTLACSMDKMLLSAYRRFVRHVSDQLEPPAKPVFCQPPRVKDHLAGRHTASNYSPMAK